MADRHVYRLRLIQDEHRAARAALRFALLQEPGVLVRSPHWQGVSKDDISRAIRRLEDTYLVRIFSEFEAILRELWDEAHPTGDTPKVDYLIDHSLAGEMRYGVLRRLAHEVQRSRNDIVHHRPRTNADLSFEEAKKRLAGYVDALR